jgi:hypothetical protein
MPTVLTSGDREDVERRLVIGLSLPPNLPSALVAIINWITAIITSLLNFISTFLGVISDDVATLDERVAKLEANVPQVAPATHLTLSTTHQQPARPSTLSCSQT